MCNDADSGTHKRLDGCNALKNKIKMGQVASGKDNPYEELDIPGRMNMEADEIAKAFWIKMQEGGGSWKKEGVWCPSTKVSLLIEGSQIQAHYAYWIRSHVQGKKHRNYLQNCHDWDNETWDSINFLALKSAFLTLGPLQHCMFKVIAQMAEHWKAETKNITRGSRVS